MASLVTPANGDLATAELIAQLTELLSGLRNIPVGLTGINDAAAYALTVKNAGSGSKDSIMYAADGTTILLQVDGSGVLASRVGGAAERVLTVGESGTVTTTMLAAHAATQNSHLTDSTLQSTTSATFVAFTPLSVGIFATGGDVLVFFSGGGFFNATAGASAFFGYSVDGGGVVQMCKLSIPAASQYIQPSFVARFAAPSAASHTYSLYWATSAGTLTAEAGTGRTLLVMEIKR